MDTTLELYVQLRSCLLTDHWTALEHVGFYFLRRFGATPINFPRLSLLPRLAARRGQTYRTEMLRKVVRPAVALARGGASLPRRAMSMPTADLCDEAGLDVSKIPSHPVKIVDPALNFKNFGGRREFSGQITTIKAYESNPAVKKAFAETGNGRVLVVVRTHPQSMFHPLPPIMCVPVELDNRARVMQTCTLNGLNTRRMQAVPCGEMQSEIIGSSAVR